MLPRFLIPRRVFVPKTSFIPSARRFCSTRSPKRVDLKVDGKKIMLANLMSYDTRSFRMGDYRLTNADIINVNPDACDVKEVSSLIALASHRKFEKPMVIFAKLDTSLASTISLDNVEFRPVGKLNSYYIDNEAPDLLLLDTSTEKYDSGFSLLGTVAFLGALALPVAFGGNIWYSHIIINSWNIRKFLLSLAFNDNIYQSI